LKIIGIVIAIFLLSLLFVWWMNLTIESTNKATTTIQQIDGNQGIQTQPGTGPIDYSKQKVEELNEASLDRTEEIEKTIP
jgi:hypothetical protein